MPGSNRRFTLAALALPLLFLAMSGLSRAATITVNTLDGGSETVPGKCSLTDAVAAANAGGKVKNCVARKGANKIIFHVTGTIKIAATLNVTAGKLTIVGPTRSPGITISGGGTVQLIVVPAGPEATLGSATLALQLLTLTNGSAYEGGAIANGGTLIVSNCTFSNNVATGEGGGAIYNGLSYNAVGALTVTDSTFSQNQGAELGGAILNDAVDPFTVTNCTFWDNTAGSGAALYSEGGPMTITDCTFADNHAGGANGNTGAVCGGMNAEPIKGSILANNTGGNCCAYGVVLSNEGYNISDDDTCDFGTSTGANGQTLGDNVNPLLASEGLADNGGPTETIALVAGSPSIEAVPLAQCTVRTDQRGDPRPEPGFGKCDIGAYEYQGLRRKKKPL